MECSECGEKLVYIEADCGLLMQCKGIGCHHYKPACRFKQLTLCYVRIRDYLEYWWTAYPSWYLYRRWLRDNNPRK